MKCEQSHAVSPIEWIQGLDGRQESADEVKDGAKKRKERADEEASAEGVHEEVEDEGERI